MPTLIVFFAARLTVRIPKPLPLLPLPQHPLPLPPSLPCSVPMGCSMMPVASCTMAVSLVLGWGLGPASQP